MASQNAFIPAFHFAWLTPWYDRMLRWMLPEERLKRGLIDQAGIASGQRILDLGCGTGTLTVMIEQAHPDAVVVGLDADAEALKLARAKAAGAGLSIAFDRGWAHRLPYGNASFDRVLSSLVLHHLTTTDKQRALVEAFRVLRPAGELHVLDFGRPRSSLAWAISLIMRHFEETADNFAGRLPAMMCRAGFAGVRETGQHLTIMGGLSTYRARKP
jgi:ubiquinone/menaquinone biosynthesis C-methylase UbiE